MRRSSKFPTAFWDDGIKTTLRDLSPDHLWVYLHLAHGPTAEVSGIYRISPGAIADDLNIQASRVLAVIADLAATGWCDYEPPVIWVRGRGNVLDQLETSAIRRNDLWVKSTVRHLDALPAGNRLVAAFRAVHGLPPAGAPGAEEDLNRKVRERNSLSIAYRSPIDSLSSDDSERVRDALREGKP